MCSLNNNLALKSQTLVSTNFPDVIAKKSGDTLNINTVGLAKTALIAGTPYTIGTLSTDMRPSQTIVKYFRLNQTTLAFLQIASGIVSINVYSDVVSGSGVYIAETFI